MTRLAALGAAFAAAVLAGEPVRIWDSANLLGAPSKDGRWLSYVDRESGGLALRDLRTGESRVVAPGGKDGEFAYFSSLSRDGAQAAYAWFNSERFYELRVVGSNGTRDRVVYRNPEAGFVQPCAWTPDGKAILTLLFRKDNISQIAMVQADGSGSRVLKSLDWIYPNRMDLSPDGRWIVYDSLAGEDAQRDIYLLRADGGEERKLVASEGNDIFPLWRPDGQSVVYVSNREGSVGVWEQPLEGHAELIAKDLGRILPLGISEAGDYYFGRRAGAVNVWLSAVGSSAAPVKLSTNLEGVNQAPAWSADGKKLAWLTRLGSENFGQESRVVSIADLETRKQRVLEVRLPHMERIRWSPDGKQLLISGSDRQGRRGLFVVDAENGSHRSAVQERAGTYHGLEGVWRADGKGVIYISDGIRMKELAGDEEAVIYGGPGRELELSPDGERIAFSWQGKVIVKELAGGDAETVASLRGGEVMGITWERDSAHLLISVPGSPPTLWRVGKGKAPTKLDWSPERVDGLRLHPDGKTVAYTAGRVWEEVWKLKLSQEK